MAEEVLQTAAKVIDTDDGPYVRVEVALASGSSGRRVVRDFPLRVWEDGPLGIGSDPRAKAVGRPTMIAYAGTLARHTVEEGEGVIRRRLARDVEEIVPAMLQEAREQGWEVDDGWEVNDAG